MSTIAIRERLRKAESGIEAWESEHKNEHGFVCYSAGELVDAKCFDELAAAIGECVEIDAASKTVTLLFKYPYEIDMGRIKTPLHLLNWVLHLSEKPWMKPSYVKAFVLKVSQFKGWKVMGSL